MAAEADVLGIEERELLARLTLQIDRCSAGQHTLARRGRVLREAATHLRLGRPSGTVLALIQEQMPEAVVTVTGQEEGA